MPSALAMTRSSGRGDEAAHEIRTGADVVGRDRDDGDIAARILPDIQRVDGLIPREKDDQVHHRGHDRPADE